MNREQNPARESRRAANELRVIVLLCGIKGARELARRRGVPHIGVVIVIVVLLAMPARQDVLIVVAMVLGGLVLRRLVLGFHDVGPARLGSAARDVGRRHAAAIYAWGLRREAAPRGTGDVLPIPAPVEREAVRRPVQERLDEVGAPGSV